MSLERAKTLSIVLLVLLAAAGWAKVLRQKTQHELGTSVVSHEPKVFHPDEFFLRYSSHFEALPKAPNAVIFLGDSITSAGQWAEMFPTWHALNRGIGGDSTAGILYRLDEIIRHAPKAIFIMIGLNDVGDGETPEYILENYRKIVGRIRSGSPRSKVFIESVLPIDGERWGKSISKESIVRVNQGLRALSGAENSVFVNLYAEFADSNGNLKRDLTVDGQHLNGAGYRLWSRALHGLL